jgi:hypothetical protein
LAVRAIRAQDSSVSAGARVAQSSKSLQNTTQISKLWESDGRSIIVIWNCLDGFLHPYPSVTGSINQEAKDRIDGQNHFVAEIPVTAAVIPLDVKHSTVLDFDGVAIFVFVSGCDYAKPSLFIAARAREQIS